MSTANLLSNLIGLSGLVGIFGQALRYYDKAHEKGSEMIAKRARSRKVVAGPPA